MPPDPPPPPSCRCLRNLLLSHSPPPSENPGYGPVSPKSIDGDITRKPIDGYKSTTPESPTMVTTSESPPRAPRMYCLPNSQKKSLFFISPRRPGTGDIPMTLCLRSVPFSFRTVTQKRIDVFSRNFAS